MIFHDIECLRELGMPSSKHSFEDSRPPTQMPIVSGFAKAEQVRSRF